MRYVWHARPVTSALIVARNVVMYVVFFDIERAGRSPQIAA